MYKLSKYLSFFLGSMLMPWVLVYGQERIEGLGGMEWHKTIGNFNFEYYGDIAQATDGSIYYSGTYSNRLFVGSQSHVDSLYQDTIPSAYRHGFVLKIDALGNFDWIWILKGGENASSTISNIQVDSTGGLWLTGWFGGQIFFPLGGSMAVGTPPFDPYLSDAFAVKLSNDGLESRIIHVGGDGPQASKKIFEAPDGGVILIIQSGHMPLTIGADTLGPDSVLNPFIAIVELNASGSAIDFRYFQNSGLGQGSYIASDIDPLGNLILQIWCSGPLSNPGYIVYEGDTIVMNGYYLIKLDTDFHIEWVHRNITQPYDGSAILNASQPGEIFISGKAGGANTHSLAYLEKYDAGGNQIWNVQTDGYEVISGGIALENDFIYWSGYYQCEMSIDTIHFKIGELEPWPSEAKTGFLCLINRHTGKLAWVMSDATTNQDKRFGKIVSQKDQYIIVATQVFSTNCTIDTLTLLAAGSELPYTLLTRLKMPTFPVWPEIMPDVPDFAIWPNPTSGTFFIQKDTSWSDETLLEVYNSVGQLVLQKTLEAQLLAIEMNTFNDQIFIVRLIDKKANLIRSRRVVLIR